MDANVSSILEPLYKHLQTIFRKLVPKSRGFSILVTEIRGSVVFSLSASVRGETTDRLIDIDNILLCRLLHRTGATQLSDIEYSHVVFKPLHPEISLTIMLPIVGYNSYLEVSH